jgi:arylformamidase
MIVDLSMAIQPHWRWKIVRDCPFSHEKGDGIQATVLSLPMHAFTHVDTPLHILPDQITIHQVDLVNLAGPAAVLDFTGIGPNQPITVESMRQKGHVIRKGDIVLLKTGWDLQRDWRTREFWKDAPYVEEKAAAWLAEQEIRAVGFDFPQDFSIRDIPERHPPLEELTTHHLILRKGIYLIEYLCNLHRVHADRVQVYALPLKVLGAEGAPARVIAVVP